MKHLSRRLTKDECHYDIQRIKEALNRNGYDASDCDIKWAWEDYSDSMAAGWMHVPDDDNEILSCILCRLEENE